ncbi:uncharacterized protein F54H12.2-like [Siphateles boraxobius]|uniref:uncharacterized protein F54H12.2-like n=1 Tax=Siphateles boraxobius TaxID=180520 RepID=UPI004064282F
MALLHRMSGECIKSELDLFTVPLTQTIIEKNSYLEVAPLSALSPSAPIEFFIAGNGDDYMDLNYTMLYLRVKITQPDGDDIPHLARVGLINYPGATIFSQVDITLGDRLISQSSSTYPYRCIIESLLNYGKDTLESLFSTSLFHKDSAGQMDVHDPPGNNAGLTKRATYTSRSREVELFTPIHADIFFQEKLLLNGVDVKLRFIRAKDEFCLMRGDDIAYKLNITAASLFVKKVSVSPPVHQVRTGVTVNNGQVRRRQGTLPKSIIIAMVDNDAFTGSYTKNPFAFKHYNLEFLAVYVDSQQFPAKPLQPNFEAGVAAREFYQLSMATGRHLKDRALCIDSNDFINGYTLYAFNLTPDEECGQHISLIKSGNIRVEARFRQPLPNTVNLIIYAVFDSLIEVSNRRQVLIDYY